MRIILLLMILISTHGFAQDTIYYEGDTIRVGELEWDLEKDWISKKPMLTSNKELYGEKIKIYHTFYRSRTVEQIAFGYVEADNFVPHGPTRYYYPGGEILGTRFYEKGLLQGEARDFHLNGRLKNIMYFKDDQPEGESRSYHEENGKLESECVFRNGLAEGRERYWYSDGSLRYISYYVKGELEGPDSTFFESGGVESVFYLKNGLEDSNCVFFHRNGIPFTQREYEKGALIKVNFVQDNAKNPLEKGNFEEGNGDLYIYSDEGKWIGYERYKKGYLRKVKYFRKPK